MAGYSRSSGIESRASARQRRAAAAASNRTSIAGTPYQVDGGIVVKANPANASEGRYERDGLFIQYASIAADAYAFTLDENGRLVASFIDATTAGNVLLLQWDEAESQYVLNLFNTIVAQFTATTIICGTIDADNGDFDYLRINASSGPAAGIPGTGECVAYMQTSGGVDYLRVKFKSGAVREIANSSHTLVQFDGIGIDGGIPSAGEIAFDTSAIIYAGGGELYGDLTLKCYGVTGDIVIEPVGSTYVNSSLQVDSDTLVLTTSKTPPNESSPGTTGQFAWDDNYLYVRVSTGWKRVAFDTMIVVTTLAIDGTEVSIDGTAIGVDQ